MTTKTISIGPLTSRGRESNSGRLRGFWATQRVLGDSEGFWTTQRVLGDSEGFWTTERVLGDSEGFLGD